MAAISARVSSGVREGRGEGVAVGGNELLAELAGDGGGVDDLGGIKGDRVVKVGLAMLMGEVVERIKGEGDGLEDAYENILKSVIS